MLLQNKRLAIILLTVALILMIPAIAMQFTGEVKWSLADFTIAAGLLLGIGLSCELVIRKVRITWQRVAICAILLAVLILTWLELAMGIFNSPIAGS